MSKYEIYNEFPLRAHEEGNEYLQGSLHGPVGKEITATELDVIGEIPKDLDGVYIRNGHNPVFQPPNGRYHWFDGDSMVHANDLQEWQGRVPQPHGSDRRFAQGNGSGQGPVPQPA